MRSLLMCSMVLTVIACSKKESGSSAAPAGSAASSAVASSGSAAAQGSAGSGSEQAAAVAASPAPTGSGAASDGADEIARRVVHDVGSKALGSQTIDASCVKVTIIPSGDWTVAAAWLNECGDKTARSIVWVYKGKNGTWNEDYVGQPPKCWKGVPPDIARAVTIATKIPSC